MSVPSKGFGVLLFDDFELMSNMGLLARAASKFGRLLGGASEPIGDGDRFLAPTVTACICLIWSLALLVVCSWVGRDCISL